MTKPLKDMKINQEKLIETLKWKNDGWMFSLLFEF